MRFCSTPATRARTSAERYADRRPTRERCNGTLCGCSATTPTSGGGACCCCGSCEGVFPQPAMIAASVATPTRLSALRFMLETSCHQVGRRLDRPHAHEGACPEALSARPAVRCALYRREQHTNVPGSHGGMRVPQVSESSPRGLPGAGCGGFPRVRGVSLRARNSTPLRKTS